MMVMLLLLIMLVSCLSLLSYLYCWRDVMNGRPHIISLRQITCVMDRNLLDMMFGKHEAGFRYLLSPTAKQWFRRQWGLYYYREVAADAICLIGAYHYLVGDAQFGMVSSFILLALTCQGINIVQSIWLVRRWQHQIIEELDEGSGL